MTKKTYAKLGNIYEQFIFYLQTKENTLLPTISYEKHHILPLHDGGQKNGPVVVCTPKNHTLAHYYHYLAYGQKGDFVAFTMRWNQKIGVNERVQLAVEKNKQLNNTFWNSEWQSIQGKKGGLKGGLKNSIKQKKARQTTGKKYGPKTGKTNASENLKYMLSKEITWIYSTKKDQKLQKLTIKPQPSLANVIAILNQYGAQKIKNPTSFYKLVHGKRKKLYGWSIFFVKL